MADSTPDPQQQQSTSDPNQGTSPAETDAEKNFWSRLESTIDKRIDEGVKRHLGSRSSGPGTQRTGRTTFRDMLADFMGGPFAEKKD